MRGIKSSVLAMIAWFGFFANLDPVRAAQSGDFTYLISGGGVAIIKYTGKGGSVSVPDTINNLPVGRVSDSAFLNCSNLTDVFVPSSVTNVGSYAFSNCTNLTTVTLSPGLRTIGGYAFNNCRQLAAIEIPSTVQTIADYAFTWCSSLSAVAIPKSVTALTRAFYVCPSLTNIQVDADNPNYCSLDGVLFSKDESVLIQCPGGKAGVYTIPDGVDTVSDGAFYYCTNLTSIRIPSSLKWTANFSFANCLSLASLDVSPASTNFASVDGVLFDKSIKNLIAYPGGKQGDYSIPFGVTNLPSYAFYCCSNLTIVKVPRSVKTIGIVAFGYCPGLSRAYFGGNAPRASYDAFSGDKFTTVFYRIEATGWGATFAGRPTALFNGIEMDFVCQTNGGAATLVTYAGFGGPVAIPQTISGLPVTAIGSNAFLQCSNVTSIDIPDGVTRIGELAFKSCVQLGSITIPATVTNIGFGAVAACTSLTEIVVDLENQNYTAEDGVLFDKNKTILIQFPAGKPGSYVVPDGVLNIGAYSFSTCTNLMNVVIPEGVTNIDNSAFSGCAKLQEVAIPKSVARFGDSAFAHCSALRSVTIPDGVAEIPVMGFAFCQGLSSVAVPDSVTQIRASAFVGCYLCGAVIGRGVSNIENDAFDCMKLNSIYFAGNAPTLGARSIYSLLPGDVTYVFYKEGTTGWGSKFAGQPAGLWVGPAVTNYFWKQNGLTATINAWCGTNGTVFIPDTMNGFPVTGFGGAFSYCSTLTNVIVPASVGVIGDYAFECCPALTSVTLPEGIGSIGQYAFYFCPRLTDITIPSSVTNIGTGAFAVCTIPGFSVAESNLNYRVVNGVLFNKEQTMLIQSMLGQHLSSYTVPPGVTNIGGWAFDGCVNLRDMIIPETVTGIGDFAFMSCSNLTAVYFSGDAPTNTEDSVFAFSPATLFYKRGTTGWSSTFAGAATTVWPEVVFQRTTNSLVLEWTQGELQESTNAVSGPWVPVQGAQSPRTVSYGEPQTFYRLRLD